MNSKVYDFDREVHTDRYLHALRPTPIFERWTGIEEAMKRAYGDCFFCGENVESGAVTPLVGGICRVHHAECWETVRANLWTAVSR